MACGCVSTSRLCDACREQRFTELRTVAALRGETWGKDLAKQIRLHAPWPADSAVLQRLAWLRVRDLGNDAGLLDAGLLDELARECASWAALRWGELRAA